MKPLVKLDNIDFKILELLRKEWVNASEIADELNSSVATVTRRIKNMQSLGVLQKPAYRINWQMLQPSNVFLVKVTLHPEKEEEGLNLFQSLNEISSIYQLEAADAHCGMRLLLRIVLPDDVDVLFWISENLSFSRLIVDYQVWNVKDVLKEDLMHSFKNNQF